MCFNLNSLESGHSGSVDNCMHTITYYQRWTRMTFYTLLVGKTFWNGWINNIYNTFWATRFQKYHKGAVQWRFSRWLWVCEDRKGENTGLCRAELVRWRAVEACNEGGKNILFFSCPVDTEDSSAASDHSGLYDLYTIPVILQLHLCAWDRWNIFDVSAFTLDYGKIITLWSRCLPIVDIDIILIVCSRKMQIVDQSADIKKLPTYYLQQF